MSSNQGSDPLSFGQVNFGGSDAAAGQPAAGGKPKAGESLDDMLFAPAVKSDAGDTWGASEPLDLDGGKRSMPSAGLDDFEASLLDTRSKPARPAAAAAKAPAAPAAATGKVVMGSGPVRPPQAASPAAPAARRPMAEPTAVAPSRGPLPLPQRRRANLKVVGSIAASALVAGALLALLDRHLILGGIVALVGLVGAAFTWIWQRR